MLKPSRRRPDAGAKQAHANATNISARHTSRKHGTGPLCELQRCRAPVLTSTAPCLNEHCLRAARLTHRRRTPFEPMATIAAGTVKPCVFKEAQSVSEQEQKPAKLRIAAGFQNRFAHQSPHC